MGWGRMAVGRRGIESDGCLRLLFELTGCYPVTTILTMLYYTGCHPITTLLYLLYYTSPAAIPSLARTKSGTSGWLYGGSLLTAAQERTRSGKRAAAAWVGTERVV